MEYKEGKNDFFKRYRDVAIHALVQESTFLFLQLIFLLSTTVLNALTPTYTHFAATATGPK